MFPEDEDDQPKKKNYLESSDEEGPSERSDAGSNLIELDNSEDEESSEIQEEKSKPAS